MYKMPSGLTKEPKKWNKEWPDNKRHPWKYKMPYTTYLKKQLEIQDDIDYEEREKTLPQGVERFLG